VTDEDWRNPVALSLGYVLSGAAGEFFTPGGQRDIDESFLVMMNAYYGDLDFRIPELPTPLSWQPLVDTSRPTGLAEGGRRYAPGEIYRLEARSLVLAINRTPRRDGSPSVERARHPPVIEPEVDEGDDDQLGFDFISEDVEADADDDSWPAPTD
jgi:glycogen operon protein